MAESVGRGHADPAGRILSPGPRGPDRDHRREIEAHIAERVDDLVAGGLDRTEAERRARTEFGDPGPALDEMRRIAERRLRRRRLLRALDELRIDLSTALRSLRRHPLHAIAVVLTLALGIGATTTLFTVVDRVLLRSLPYADANRIATVWSVDSQGRNTSLSLPDFFDLRAGSGAFESLAFIRGGSLTRLDGERGASRLGTAFVTEDFEAALRPKLAYGSLSAFADGGVSEAIVALSYDAFLRHLGGDPGRVGEVLSFRDGGRRLVAVLAPEVEYPLWADAYTPLREGDAEWVGLSARDYRLDNRAVGRLSRGATLASARAELLGIAERLARAYPDTNREWGATAEPLRDLLVGDQETSLWVLLAAVGGLLAIAVANAAGLAVSRVMSRGRELGVRASLGMPAGRIARLVALESVLLSLVGGALGTAVALAATPRLTEGAGGTVQAAGTLGVDARIAAVALLISIVVGLAAGALPALLGSRTTLTQRIRRGDSSRAAERTRAILVGTQVALSVGLVATTVLFARSLSTLQSVETGVETEGLTVSRLTLPSEYHGVPERRRVLWDDLVRRLGDDSAVEAATVVNHAPLVGTGVLSPARVEGGGGEVVPSVWLRMTGERFFDIADIELLSGRVFGSLDHAEESDGVVVSAAAARSLWGGVEVLGKRLTLERQLASDPDFQSPIEATVIGVVEDTRAQLRGEAVPAVYLPMRVHPWTSAYLIARAPPGPRTEEAVRSAILSVDPTLPIGEIRAYSDLATRSIQRDRFVASLSSTFAALALLLAWVGIYGAMTFAVQRSSRSLAIRIALGSTSRQASGAALRPTLLAIAAGALTGAGLAAALAPLTAALLVDTAPLDPQAIGIGVATIAAVALAAGWLPARRAARTDPVEVLRD